jgi:two-component system, OmpR family, sensor histidine kinase BaeS
MRIQYKLISIFFIFSALLAVSLMALFQWSIGKGMVEYVNAKDLRLSAPLVNVLANRFGEEGSWQSLRNNHLEFSGFVEDHLQTLEEEQGPRPEFRPPPPRRPGQNTARNTSPQSNSGAMEPPPHRANQPPRREALPPPDIDSPPQPRVSYALLDENKQYIVGRFPPRDKYGYREILFDGEVVGYLAIGKRDRLADGFELNFVERQQDYIGIITLGLLLLSLLVSWPLARHLVKPIADLAKAMTGLAQGRYGQKLQLKRNDEFAQLNRDFNALSSTLASNETARKRWLGDISHELRTPVAVLRGELEAMLDGVRPLDLRAVQSAHDEIRQLQRLIDDLHELTRTDIGTMHYRKSNLELGQLIDEQAEKYRGMLAEHGIKLAVNRPQKLAMLFADNNRLQQLFANIFTNICKYAADGDLCKLSLLLENNTAQVTIEDNGPGVEDEHLSHLFEHLYRVENSRNRKLGGSGLGLSICRQIVEAHQGEIRAERSTLGGLAIIICFPLL